MNLVIMAYLERGYKQISADMYMYVKPKDEGGSNSPRAFRVANHFLRILEDVMGGCYRMAVCLREMTPIHLVLRGFRNMNVWEGSRPWNFQGKA